MELLLLHLPRGWSVPAVAAVAATEAAVAVELAVAGGLSQMAQWPAEGLLAVVALQRTLQEHWLCGCGQLAWCQGVPGWLVGADVGEGAVLLGGAGAQPDGGWGLAHHGLQVACTVRRGSKQ